MAQLFSEQDMEYLFEENTKYREIYNDGGFLWFSLNVSNWEELLSEVNFVASIVGYGTATELRINEGEIVYEMLELDKGLAKKEKIEKVNEWVNDLMREQIQTIEYEMVTGFSKLEIAKEFMDDYIKEL